MRCLLCDCDVQYEEPSLTIDGLCLHAWCARGFVVDVIRELRKEIATLRSAPPSGRH
jgi:hypothetical protein